jgi:prophage regulatory protein
MKIERQIIIKLQRVKEITTLSRATIYRRMAEGKFPKQIKLSERACAWVEQEVLDWLDSCIEDRYENDK